jgi:hypothetical protein
MRKSKSEPINKVLQQFLKENGLEHRYLEAKACRLWPEIMGKTVSNRTKNIYTYQGKLFVNLDSSVLRNEMLIMKQGIIDELNRKLGKKVIFDIVFR